MAQVASIIDGKRSSPVAIEKGVLEQTPIAWFSVSLTALFSSLQLVNILHHAMWRDELQVWMIARRSHTIAELLSLKKYEGHPDAWYLLVYLITKITTHPIWMQVFHIFIASITVYVIARYSPFRRAEKILIVFGYFLFFEYATISRGYGLGFLGLFIFCAAFNPGPRKNYILLAALLGLMCQTSVYAVIVVLCFVAAMVFEATQTPSWRQSVGPIRWQFLVALMITGISIGVSVVRIRPPSDGGYVTGLNLGLTGLSNSLSMFWRSFVPIPQLTRTFWNSNILQVPGFLFRLMALLGIVIFCVSVLFFVRKPVVLFAYVCGAGALFVFKQLVFPGYMRHDGFVFMLFLACLWLACGFPERRFPLDRVERTANWFATFRTKVLVAFLAIHAAAGLAVSGAAVEIPFSQARSVAEYIRSRNMDQWTIIGDQDAPVSAVAGYLDREVYYVMGNRSGTFLIWDKKRLIHPAEPAIIQFAVKTATESRRRTLVILSYPSSTAGNGVSEIASFEGAIVNDENYYLYVVQPAAGASGT